MKDPRGIERGACNNCTCAEYELEPQATRAACSYCECPAPAHMAIAIVVKPTPPSILTSETPQPSTSTSTTGRVSTEPPMTLSKSSSFSSATSNQIILDVSPSSFLSDLLDQPSERTDSTEPTTDEIFLPAVLPKKLQQAIKAKKLDANAKSAVVREVHCGLLAHSQTSNAHLRKATKKVMQRWSPMKDPFDKDGKAFFEKLRRRRDRCNLNLRTPNSDDGEGEDSLDIDRTPEEARKNMTDRWTSGERSAAAFRADMQLTRRLRREESKKTPGLILFRRYPAFGIKTLVLEEFESAMGRSQEQMVRCWTSAVPNVLKFLLLQNVDVNITGTVGEQTLSILENIHLCRLWCNSKKAENKSAVILTVHPENTSIDEIRPGPKEAPRLLGIRSGDNVSLHGYVDTEPYFVEDDPILALILLLSTYYLMGIKFSPLTRLPLVFLSSIVVGAEKVAADITRNLKLGDALRKYNLLT